MQLLKHKLLFLSGLLLCLLLSACSKVFPPSPYHCENEPKQYKNLAENTRYIFVLWRSEEQSQKNFETLLFGKLSDQLLAIDSPEVRYWVADPHVESMTLRQHPRADGAVVAAVISMQLTDVSVATSITALLKQEVNFVASYQVNNSLPLDYEKTWPDGDVSPGVVSMSFFQRKSGLDTKAFKDYWFCSHTPFALEVHPLWRYERNPVVMAISNNAPGYDGIVPLHMQTDTELEDFSKFFGADGNWAVANALRIQADVSHFIDLDKIEATAMREYVMRSLPRKSQ